ncbi:hypothetical protein C0992_004460 [Termitomyces sp. T32_za158]|nr:hypothetical protein C0992_004460 [Termitomyces sp. T32_za158]
MGIPGAISQRNKAPWTPKLPQPDLATCQNPRLHRVCRNHLPNTFRSPNELGASFDYASRYPEAIRELSAGLIDGSLKRKFHIIDGGIEQAPKSLPLLFSGGNTGKLYAVALFQIVEVN